MWESPAVVVALLGLAFNLLVTVIGGVWKLSRLELALRGAIDESTKEVDERIDRHVRYFGEAVAAVRQKVVEVEIFARDTFVRKDEFGSQIKDLGDRLEARLDRLESKIDTRA